MKLFIFDPNLGSFELLGSEEYIDECCCEPEGEDTNGSFRFKCEESDEDSELDQLVLSGILDAAFIEQVKTVSAEMIRAQSNSESVLIEVNRLKFEYKQSFANCAKGIVQGLLAAVKGAPESHFEEWGSLLEKYVVSSEVRQIVIEELADAVKGTEHSAHFHVIVKVLYVKDIIEEDNIIQWDQESCSEHLKSLMEPFIEWLLQDDEEE